MAPAGRGVVVVVLSFLYLFRVIFSTEYFSTLTFFNSELHKHGCSSPSEWEEYASDCESSILQLDSPDCEEGSNPPCESVFSLNTEKILSQAKLFIEQKRFPFAVDNHNTNEELAIGYVLIGNGLYDEAIKHFSLLLQEAIETFKEALKLKSDFIDAYKSLGQAYRELGDFEAAMESFQKALMLNQNHIQSLQLRGMMLYHHGSLQEAIGNFKRCLQLEPYNEVCQYMKGLSHVAMGQFYEGIKAQTKVMLNDPLLGQKASSEYLKVKYLREYSRYLHSHLDIPVAEYNVDQDLPGNFKNHWAKNLPFLIEDYEEQPGLQPHIKDVLPQNFESYNTEVQKLICTADHLGALMQYNTPGFLPNRRIHRAMGLATLEVMQAMQRTWSNSKVRVNGKTRQMQWRDMFDIAVKWRRIADPDQPVLWLDQMPARSLSRGFNNHINLIRGQIINIRYLAYFEKILNFIKDRILVYHGAYNPRGLLEVRQALENVDKVEDLLPIMKQFNSKTRDGFTVNSKVPSLKDPGKEYDGFTITITGDRVGNMLFSVETQTTEERTQQYQSEIESIYKDLTAKGKALMLSTELGDADAVCNLILSLVYYFCNLMPLSRGSSVVAYSVVMGALMASGKEVIGRIPKGKVIVTFCSTLHYFILIRYNIDTTTGKCNNVLPLWYQSLPSVAETFQTTRTMIEVLNTDSTSHCPKKS
uniref:Tetratricopeptide repeat domain 13 n=1 Tax=Salmo trutta TaxID=8032 RepID=A0A673Y6W4_SALTR